MRSTAFLMAGAIVMLTVAGCAPSHRLAEVEMESRSVAVMAAIPPGPHLVTGPWPQADRPIRASGEAMRRYEASRSARARLDEAAASVDLAEVLARHAILESARLMGFRPENDPDTADFLLDVRFRGLHFAARHIDAVVNVYADAELILYRRDTDEVVWHRQFKDRRAVDPAVFNRDDLGRRLTAREMTLLSTAEMAWGIEGLVLAAADRMAESLADAYRRAHR